MWDRKTILLETNGSNIIQVVHTVAPRWFGAEVSQRVGGSSDHYHFDGLGSTEKLTDGTGTVANSYIYDAYGNILSSSGSVSNSFQYVGLTGYWYEPALGVYSLRTRWYDSVVGRFLSKDPLGLDAGDTNLYRYVGNTPVNSIDPSGLDEDLLPGSFWPSWLGYVDFNAGFGVGEG